MNKDLYLKNTNELEKDLIRKVSDLDLKGYVENMEWNGK
jgi:hypothetical protein